MGAFDAPPHCCPGLSYAILNRVDCIGNKGIINGPELDQRVMNGHNKIPQHRKERLNGIEGVMIVPKNKQGGGWGSQIVIQQKLGFMNGPS